MIDWAFELQKFNVKHAGAGLSIWNDTLQFVGSGAYHQDPIANLNKFSKVIHIIFIMMQLEWKTRLLNQHIECLFEKWSSYQLKLNSNKK